MPYYAGLRKLKPALRKRTVAGLQALRAGLREEVPTKRSTDTLLLATWNIREFDSGKFGLRTEESYYYIAEILSHFDLIAIQEVRGMYPLQQLCRLLGSWWDFLVTDITLGTSGNSERIAFLYDRRKVSTTGLTAELVLPSARGAKKQPVQFARTPYVAGFHAGWAYFTLATVHIYYGKGVAADPRRLQEITDLATTLAKGARELSSAPQYEPDKPAGNGNLLILGDFNIFNRKDATFEALKKAKFVVPEGLQEIPGSNVDKNKHYDQIAYLKQLTRMSATGQAGVFDFYKYVFNDESQYAAERGRKGGTFKAWRTYQMSDHLPMWVEFSIDDADSYLASLK